MALSILLAENLRLIYPPGDAVGGESAQFGKLISPLIQDVLIVAGVAALFFIVFAGFNYITAGGDKNKTQSASDALTYAIIGLMLVAAAFLITTIVGKVVGFNIFNP